MITQKRVQDKLIDAASITHVFKLTEHIACVVTGQIREWRDARSGGPRAWRRGSRVCARVRVLRAKVRGHPPPPPPPPTRHRAADARSQVQKARQMASEFEFNNGYAIPVAYLAKKLADENQIYTQHAYRRSLAVIMLLAAVDDEAGPQLFKVDPAGHFLSFKVRVWGWGRVWGRAARAAQRVACGESRACVPSVTCVPHVRPPPPPSDCRPPPRGPRRRTP